MTDKLKVGIMDMLTLLLPGGFLLYMLLKTGLMVHLAPGGFELINGQMDSWPRVVLFIAAAYVAGHFIYLLASNLDGWIYENVRRVFWNDHRLVAYILERKAALTGIDDRTVINGFKWSCAWLLKNAPTLYAEVERLMAESKFFRSLVVVCFISSILLAGNGVWGIAVVMLVMSFLSLFRYLVQRQKSIDAAYVYMITALAEQAPFPAKPSRERLFELRSRSLAAFTDHSKALPYETSKYLQNRAAFKGYCRKIGAVIKLCAWPWYVFDISPEGPPTAKTQELRWFTKTDPLAFKTWLLELCGNAYAPEDRADTYYLKKNMGMMSIKDRGQKGVYEIKRLLPFDEKLSLPKEREATLEHWYKWIIPASNSKRFKSLLDKGHYKPFPVAKKRWRKSLEGVNCQVEYTVINVADWPIWYTVAIEFSDAVRQEDIMAMLATAGIEKVVPTEDVSMFSYPAFLGQEVK